MNPPISSRLAEILESKKAEVDRIGPLAEKLRFAALERNEFRSFENALRREKADEEDDSADADPLRLIAEVKRASPSAGVIAETFDPAAVAREYFAAGAGAVSVLTDEPYFHGRLEYLPLIRGQIPLPLLRKDFIIDPVQVWESSVAGADAILLIVAALEQDQLAELMDTARTCQLDVLVEVHSLEELDRALEINPRIIGINNRNLATFEVSLETTRTLSEQVPDDIVLVSESGLHSARDAAIARAAGVDAILVGEALMRAPDVAALARELMEARAPS